MEGAEGNKTKSSINEARYLPPDDEDAEDEDGMSKEVRALFAKCVLVPFPPRTLLTSTYPGSRPAAIPPV